MLVGASCLSFRHSRLSVRHSRSIWLADISAVASPRSVALFSVSSLRLTAAESANAIGIPCTTHPNCCSPDPRVPARFVPSALRSQAAVEGQAQEAGILSCGATQHTTLHDREREGGRDPSGEEEYGGDGDRRGGGSTHDQARAPFGSDEAAVSGRYTET